MMNQDLVINKLVERRVIERAATRGQYYIAGEPRNITFKRNAILSRFAIEVEPYKYILNEQEIVAAIGGPRPTRTLTILSYGSSNHGAQDEKVARALNLIERDADGVRRSFGLEYEIYTMTREQQSDLAYLLDTLPAHEVHSDGSLGVGGVEVVFYPVGAAKYIETVNKLNEFVRSHNIRMERDDLGNGAGMHTTYGVDNFEATKADLQIRLNRIALAVKSVGTQRAIKELFGRDFGNYRELPTSTTYNAHGNAFSTNGRPSCCWECRILSWRCKVEKVVEFLKATEFAFHRPFEAQDFAKVFEILGSNTAGC